MPAVGGAQIHAHHFFKQILHEHQIDVFSLWNTNRFDWLLGSTLQLPVEPFDYIKDGVRVRSIRLSNFQKIKIAPYVASYYLAKNFSAQQIANEFYKQLKAAAKDYDIFQNVRIGREPLSLATLELAKSNNKAFIFVPNHHPRWSGGNYSLYKNIYRQADIVVALTNLEKLTLNQLGVKNERIFVTGISPVVDANAKGHFFKKKYSIPDDAPLILFLGQKYEYKNFSLLLAARDKVWSQFPDAHFAFVGPRTAFSKKIFKQINDPRIIEIDTLSEQEKSEALDACVIMCMPSSQESFGGVFVEAWAFKKPVIGGNIPAVSEVIDNKKNGLLVNFEIRDLSAAVLELLKNKDYATELGAAGHKKLQENYSNKILVNKWLDIYARADKKLMV